MKISTQRIEVLMLEKGLTLTALAERSGISRQSLGTIRRRQTCQIATAAKLCKGLDCDTHDIIPPEYAREV